MPVKRIITVEQWLDLSDQLKVEVAALKAIAAVESRGEGFLPLPDDRPKILFEGHWFQKFTSSRYDLSNPNISYPYAKREEYYKLNQWKQMDEAEALDRDAAWKSASWGVFQVMGFNYKICGFPDVASFVVAMKAGAFEQMQVFGKFINQPNILLPLRGKNWPLVALAYNGTAYRDGNYDGKLRAAYAKENAASGYHPV